MCLIAARNALSDKDSIEEDYAGHRDRLRTRFLTAGADALQDYEMLEMLLFTALPRRDVKPLAKALLRSFGSLWCVFNASPEALRKAFPKMTDGTIAALTIVGAAALRMTRQEILNKPVLSTWQRLLDYCQGVMANEATEQFRLLFLDRKNTLIADEVQQRGTVDHTPLYPREIVKRALELAASAIIMVHNHPSGDPTPSKADLEMTKQVVAALAAVGITVHDHVIVGKNKHTSFKTQRLI
jgi:DNA repair protein RadC